MAIQSVHRPASPTSNPDSHAGSRPTDDEPHADARSWLFTLLPVSIALVVVVGLLLGSAAVVSRGIGLVSGLLTGG